MFSMALCTPQSGSSPSALDEARKKYPPRQLPIKLGNPCTHLHVLTFHWRRNNGPRGSPLVLSCPLEGGVMWVKWNSSFTLFNFFLLLLFRWYAGSSAGLLDFHKIILICECLSKSIFGGEKQQTPILPYCSCTLGLTIFLITVI